MPTGPLTSPALAPRWKRARFWFGLLVGVATGASLLLGAFIVVIVGEARWSRHVYVLDNEDGTVNVYDAATGAVIAAPLARGLINPGGITVSGNTLYLITHRDEADHLR